jgi:hypothetical protein
MTISTSLIEFEESPGIRTFFELESNEPKPSALFVLLEDRLLACLEIVRGTSAEEIDLVLEKSIEFEVNGFGGLVSKLHEDFPDGIATSFTFENRKIRQYHMFHFGEIALTAHLTILSEWYEEDLTKFHKFLASVKLHESKFLKEEIGAILPHENFSESIDHKVGLRSYLGNRLVTI